jgi:hypothetical protein
MPAAVKLRNDYSIFTANDEQKRVALDTIADVDASGLWPGRLARSGEPSRSIRIISGAVRTAIPATLSAPTGFCPSEPPRSRSAPGGGRTRRRERKRIPPSQ